MSEKMFNSVGAAVIKDGKVFVVKNEEDGKWVFPYGEYHVEEGITDSLKEIMKERFGVEIDVKDFVHSSSFDYENAGDVVLSVYTAELKNGELPDGENYKWETPAELVKDDITPVCDLIAVKLHQMLP